MQVLALVQQHKQPEAASRAICRHALAAWRAVGAADNIAVVVIAFDWNSGGTVTMSTSSGTRTGLLLHVALCLLASQSTCCCGRCQQHRCGRHCLRLELWGHSHHVHVIWHTYWYSCPSCLYELLNTLLLLATVLS